MGGTVIGSDREPLVRDSPRANHDVANEHVDTTVDDEPQNQQFLVSLTVAILGVGRC